MSRYDDELDDDIEDEDLDDDEEQDDDVPPRRQSVNPFSSGGRSPSPFNSGGSQGGGSRFNDSSRLPGNPGGARPPAPGGSNPPGGARPGGSPFQRPPAPGGGSTPPRPGTPPSSSNPGGPNRPSPFGSPPARSGEGDKKDDKPGGGLSPRPFGGGDKGGDDKKDDKPGGGFSPRPSPFANKDDDKKDDKPGGGLSPRPFGGGDKGGDKKDDAKKDDKPGGGLGGRLPFGNKGADDKKDDAKKDDKPGGGLGGRLPFGNKGGDDKKDDAKKDDKPGGGLGGRLPFGNKGGDDKKDDAKKDDKSGGGLGGRFGSMAGGLTSRFGGGDKPDDKKDDKPSGGGLGGRLPFGNKGGDDKKPDAKKDDKSGGGGLGGRFGSMAGGLTSRFGGGDKPDDKPATPKGSSPPAGGAPKPAASSPPKPGGAPSPSPLGNRFGSGAPPGEKPATPKGTAKKDSPGKSPVAALKERITGFSLFKKSEPKTARQRQPKAPTVKREGMSLDTKLDILGVVLVLGSLAMIFSSLSPNQGQLTGGINSFLSTNLGWGALAVPLFMFGAGVWLILRHFGEEAPILDATRVIGLGMVYIGLLVVFQYVDSFSYDLLDASDPMERLRLYLQISQLLGRGGGWIGAEIYFFLVTQLTEIGGFFIVMAWMVIGIMLMLSLSAAELAIIVISVVRSFNDARKRRVQRRAAMLAERQAAAPAAFPQVNVAKPAPEALPGGKSPALPAPAAAQAAPPIPATPVPEPVTVEERSIPITQGGRTVTASFRPGEPVTVEAKESAPARPQPSLFPPKPQPAPTTEAPAAEKAEPASAGGGGSRFGGFAARMRDAIPTRGKSEDGGKPAEPAKETKPEKHEGDGIKPAAVVGGFVGAALSRVKDAIPAGKAAEKPEEAKPAGAKPQETTPQPAAPTPAQTAPAASTAPANAAPADESEKPTTFGTLLGQQPKEAPPARPTEPERTSTGERPSPFAKPAASTEGSGVKPSPFAKPGEPERATTGEHPSPFSKPAASSDSRTGTGERPSPFGKPGEPERTRTGERPSPFNRPAASSEGSGVRPSPFGRPPEPAKAEGDGAKSGDEAKAAEPAKTSTGERPAAFRANVPPPVVHDEAEPVEDSEELRNLPPARPKGILQKPPEQPPTPASPFGRPPQRDTATPMANSPKPAFGTIRDRLGDLRSRDAAKPEDDAKPDEAKQETITQEAPKQDGATPAASASPVAPSVPQAPPRRVPPWEDEKPAEAPKPETVQPAASTDGKPAAEAPKPQEEPRPAPRIVSMDEDEIEEQLKAAGKQSDAEAQPDAMPPMTDSRPGGLRPSGLTSDAAHRMPERPTPPPPPARQASAAFTPPAGPPGAPPPPPQGARPRKEYQLPDYHSLLQSGSDQELDHNVLIRRAKVIEETLESFGAPGRVVEVRTGPVITQFGVEPDYLPGRGGKKIRVKVSSIAQLDKDMQLALGAKSIRIEAPVPGKGYVGIEVPNEEAAVVRLRDVLESQEFRRINSPLAICLGQGVDGTPVAADLGNMPHLLIAGTTGSGKSVCVNTIIASLLLKNTPDRLKFIMVDPKRVELTGYNGIPHLVAPVVVELERIVGVLKWVTREMDERYKKFSSAGARNIEDFNKHRPQGEPLMPYIVVIIDELADLMMLAPDETERVITRIAALARATGIHLVIATQRPSVDVVTGLIKANFPARIAFAVASMMDSRVILDQPGAERLLGRGDMLYMSPDSPAPLRLQGVFVSDNEINNITRAWRGQMDAEDLAQRVPISSFFNEDASSSAPVSSSSAWAPPGNGSRSGQPQRPPAQQVAFWDRELREGANNSHDDDDDDGGDGEDAMYDEAVELVRRLNKASVSLLQRRLRIGYTRAARLIDIMEERGVVGPPTEGSKPREVLPAK